MDYKQIQDLIKLVNRSNLAELSIENKDFKIKMRTVEGAHAKGSPTTHVVAPVAPAHVPASAPAAAATPTAEKASEPETPKAKPEEANYVTVNSPMVGTFYRRPTPEDELFVKPGDSISEGQVLCVIEAMKLFNEIESEVSGKIVKILVDDASPVEYDQPLFLVDPKG